MLKLDYSENESPLIVAIKGKISEEILVLDYKDKVEAQLQDLQAVILGKKVAIGNGNSITAVNKETEKFLEYTYAKILKDHYKSIIYNDFIK
jgi:hypothetical protein